MPRFYKGVGVGTHLHGFDLRAVGINAQMPALPCNLNTVMNHIARATTTSPCISLTRSYGVAEEYAVDASRATPTAANPAFVYEIDIPDPAPGGMRVIDPVIEVASGNNNPLASLSYHHDGNMDFLLGVVDPTGMVHHLGAHIRTPLGAMPTPRPANLSIELETFVRALRDAEVLVVGAIPNTHVLIQHPVY
jgi:hypothetical protein